MTLIQMALNQVTIYHAKYGFYELLDILVVVCVHW